MDITAIWKPEYSVGHKDIDAQHKYLFENEEKYLQYHPKFDDHRKIHANFINQTQTFMDQFQKDTLDTHTVVDYLHNWLIKHIVETDIRYFKDLKELEDKL